MFKGIMQHSEPMDVTLEKNLTPKQSEAKQK